MKNYIIGLGIMIGILLMPAFATEMSGLNVAEVPIKNQSDQSLQQVLPQSISQVLIKLSGNPGVVTLPQIQNVLQNPESYVQSYSFFTRNNAEGNSQTFAKITFDEKGLIALLRQAGQAVWGRNRPLMLVWLKTDVDESGSIVSNNDDSGLSEAVIDSAKRRGLPIILPDMDLQDQSFINTNMEKTFDSQKLQAAENRYQVNIILAGDINPMDNNHWQGQWYLLFYGQPFQWDDTANDPNILISKAIDNAANILANQLATINNKSLQTSVRMEIIGVNNLSDYVRVIKYLKRLSLVSNIDISHMENNSLILNVTTVGGSEKLMSALQGSHYLKAIQNPNFQNNQAIDLYYQWQDSVGQHS